MRGLWQRWHQGRWQVLLSAYLDGQLSARDRRRLEGHLGRCAACHRDMGELRVTVQTLRRLPTLALPRSFTLTAPPSPAAARRSSNLSPLLRPAQAIAVAAVLGFLVVALGDVRGSLPADERGLALFAEPQTAAPAAAQLPEASLFQAQSEEGRSAEASPPEVGGVSAPHRLYLALEGSLLALALLSGAALLALRVYASRRRVG